MARPTTFSRLGSKPNTEKKAEMLKMLKAGANVEAVAAVLGYANAKFATVMINRWGLWKFNRYGYVGRHYFAESEANS